MKQKSTSSTQSSILSLFKDLQLSEKNAEKIKGGALPVCKPLGGCNAGCFECLSGCASSGY